VPYKEKFKISLRPINFEEAENISLIKSKPLEIINLLNENNVVKVENMDFYDLTYDDWRFIELTLANLSYPSIKFNINGGECPDCKDHPEHIKLNIGGKEKDIEIKPELKLVLIPSEVAFEELEDEVSTPIMVNLSIGNFKYDFYRLKHFKILTENDNISNEIKKYDILTNQTDKYSFEDIAVLRYLNDFLNHGPKSEFELKCPQCKKLYKIVSAWEVADFLPFRRSTDDIRFKIRFGKGASSTGRINKEIGIS